MREDAFHQAAEMVRNASSLFAFTGAGISTESGIPDFRSPQGIWARNQPVYYDQFLSSATARYEYWRQKALLHPEFEAASPNVTHETLAEWETSGPLVGIVTQNIDGLHQLAGSQNVLELHGTAREIGCLDCFGRWPAGPLVREFLENDRVPDCPVCGGSLKHATISFGQSLPERELELAAELARQCDLCLVLGSSLVVYPAAGIPELAKAHGKELIIINREATPLDSRADLVIQASLGEAMRAIGNCLRHE